MFPCHEITKTLTGPFNQFKENNTLKIEHTQDLTVDKGYTLSIIENKNTALVY